MITEHSMTARAAEPRGCRSRQNSHQYSRRRAAMPRFKRSARRNDILRRHRRDVEPGARRKLALAVSGMPRLSPNEAMMSLI